MVDLTRSMSLWSPAKRKLAVLLTLLFALPLAIICGWRMGSSFELPDTTYYLHLAAGDVRHTMLPFASRQLGPLLVRSLVHLLPLSIHAGFVLEGLIALPIFLGITTVLLVRSGSPQILIPMAAGMLFWAQQFNGLVLPDLVYAALLSIFLWLLQKQSFLAAALMMFPLAISRESTVLTLVCFLLAGWRHVRRTEMFVAAGSTAAGLIVVKHLAAGALPNKEHISPLFYMAAKMPWNFLRNVLGLIPWANVYPACEAPKWTVALHLGALHAVGFCGVDGGVPLELISDALASFGLLPLLLLKVRRSEPEPESGKPDSMLLRFSLVYGGVSFLLAPLLGESFIRLFAYSWPLFLVALPRLLGRRGGAFSSSQAALAFLVLHLLLSWAELRLYRGGLLAFALVIYLLGWLLLRQTWCPEAHPSPARSQA